MKKINGCDGGLYASDPFKAPLPHFSKCSSVSHFFATLLSHIEPASFHFMVQLEPDTVVPLFDCFCK